MHIPQTEVILRYEGAELAHVTLPPGEYIIGRSSSVDIQADTPSLSRRHARLTIEQDQFFLQDLGSSHGTFINGQALAEPTRLFLGQPVRLGDTELELRRPRVPLDPGVVLAPAEAAIRRFLPDELLAEKRYSLGSQIARGGMGAILDARQNTTQRDVAMKVMLAAADEASVLRFIEEAQVTAQLDHPNIVPIYELGVDEQGQLFYTMKLVRGITLKKVLELLRDGDADMLKKYPLSALLTVFQKVCDAVAFAHAKGVIHRDLKPENIMLGDFGSVLVMDWGLAKVFSRRSDSPHRASDGLEVALLRRSTVFSARALHGDSSHTLHGTVLGTPAYMSPEQARGEVDDLDARSDLYALGAILFEMLHWRATMKGRHIDETLEMATRGEVDWTPPKRLLPASLLAVCRKALAVERDDRYASVEELQRDLAAYQSGFATSAENAGLGRQFLLALKRHKTLTAAIALVLLTGGGFGARAIIEGRRAEREAVRANQALADLKKTAPALRQLASSESTFQRFDSALEKLDAALALDSSDAASYWQRAWIFIGLERWPDAIAALRLAREKDPAQAWQADIIPMLEEIAAAPEAQRWKPERTGRLVKYLETVGAGGELAALSGKLRLDAGAKRQLVEDRIRQWLGSGSGRVEVIGAGLIQVSLQSLNLDTLEPLRGLPIDRLWPQSNHITSLEPLRGMKISAMDLFNNPVTDLSPLQGMPLREITLGGTRVRDFSPLRGAPLERFSAWGLNIVDFSFLKGAPLRWVSIGNNPVTDLRSMTDGPLEELVASGGRVDDLSPIRGKPLRILRINANRVRDLSPLRGAPIVELDINGNPIEDYRPLLDLPKLEKLYLNHEPQKFLMLRQHPRLKYIGTRDNVFRPVAEFWAEYDPLQKGAAAK